MTLLVLLLGAAPAAAHAELVESTPSAGEQVSGLERVELRFDAAMDPASSHVWLEDDAGALPLQPVTTMPGDDRTLTAPVPPVAEGTFVIGYHATSTDGHAVSGGVPVTLGLPQLSAAERLQETEPSTELAAAPPSHQHAADPSTGVARIALDVALAVLVGGLAFLVVVWPEGAGMLVPRRILWAAAMSVAVSSAVLSSVQPGTNGDGATVLRLGLLAAFVLVLLWLGRLGPGISQSLPWRLAAGTLALGLLQTIVSLGHSATDVVGQVIRIVHAAGVSVWLGGLVMLVAVVLPRRRRAELVHVLPRFSVMATVAVATVLAAGVLLSVDLVGVPGSLPSTPYGRILLLKLVVVGLLLIAAARSRVLVRERLHVAATTGVVATWVGVEVGLMAVVLVLTAVLVGQAPPT